MTIEQLYDVFIKNPVVCTDSRTIEIGSLFFALKGPAFNGNAYAENAITKGAAYAVIDQVEFKKDDRYLVVENVLITLQELANYHRNKLNIPFLAITGSNGKTTTKELIRNVLSKKYKTVATKGNLNNHIGVPLTILSISPDTKFAVIEMGANHLGEIESYCHIAEPDYGLITNVGKAHLEGFGGFEGVKKGKGELYHFIGKNGKKIFINDDSKHLNSMIASDQSMLVKYGTAKKLYCSGKLESDSPGLTVSWQCNSKTGIIQTKIIGSYNFENILSAVCVGNYFGVDPDDINSALAGYEPDNSRSQVINRNSNTIILDAYNANPTSMEAALSNFEKIPSDHKIVFIGEMAELGNESGEEHKKIADLLDGKKYEKIILVGNNFLPYAKMKSCLYFDNSEKAALWLKDNPVQNSYLLIKGSRSMKMERILDAV